MPQMKSLEKTLGLLNLGKRPWIQAAWSPSTGTRPRVKVEKTEAWA